MLRTSGENLRSVYVLLFLNIAFFLLEVQDPERYALLFAFDGPSVASGEVWRLVTWQFTQSGQGFMQALSLFFTLLLLYIMGGAMEEEWGTLRFLTLFVLSTGGSAAAAALLGIPILGTYFVHYTLLFVYAAAFPGQTFFLFGVIPVRVRLLAAVSLAFLVLGIFRGGMGNVAALAGAILAGLYYVMQQRVPMRPARTEPVAADLPIRPDSVSTRNAARAEMLREALASADEAEIDRLKAHCETEIVAGVNICPPADFKPYAADGYCLRCEGFAECSARHLELNRPSRLTPSA